MNKLLKNSAMIISLLSSALASHAAQLAIVIDDFGYRTHNEKLVLALSPNITVAVLPNSPNAANIATYAHNNGNDVMIHLPMAPMGKQPLEVDTLTPQMDKNEIQRIIGNAIENVPYAIGINNHMGSLMTSSLPSMQNVMQVLSHDSLFFLDSKTIGHSQALIAAQEYRVPSIGRDIFLDDSQKEADVAHQFDLAVKHAQKQGSAVAIGHPYPVTINVLTAKLAQLPADVELVKVSQLVNVPTSTKLSDIFTKQKIHIEQGLFDYMILKQTSSQNQGKNKP